MVDGPEIIQELFEEESSYGRNTVVMIVTTFLMGLITLAAAWSGFQATKWHGEMINTFMAARAVHDESSLVTLAGNQKLFVDIHMFLRWISAEKANSPELADFYYTRMREELIPVVDAWLATNPLENPDAPKSPFIMPEYIQGKEEESSTLNAQFDVLYDEAVEANRISEEYILVTVVLASGLFFAGIATRLRNPVIEIIVTCFALAAFIYTAYYLVSFPTLI